MPTGQLIPLGPRLKICDPSLGVSQPASQHACCTGSVEPTNCRWSRGDVGVPRGPRFCAGGLAGFTYSGAQVRGGRGGQIW